MQTTQRSRWDLIESFIKSVRLPFRGDCPECGGKGCFSASRINGVVLYHCYRPSCNLRGRKDYEVTVDDLRSNDLYVAGSSLSSMGTRQDKAYIIPDYFISPLANSRCYSFLSRFNLLDLYTRFTDRIRYCPKTDRLVFILKDTDNVCRGATGRSLSFSPNNPRWFVYSRLDGCPFTLSQGNNRYGLLVEDCVSACAVTKYSKLDYDGISLLGTSIPDETIKYLLGYEKVFIALDDDALSISLKLQKRLSPYVHTSIIAIKKDLKFFSRDEFLQLENEYLL